jgi:hypothetical protein
MLPIFFFSMLLGFPLAANVNWDTGLQVIDSDPCNHYAHLQAHSYHGPQQGNAHITIEVFDGTNWVFVTDDHFSFLEGEYDFFLDANTMPIPLGFHDFRANFHFEVDANCPTGHWNSNEYDWNSDPVNVHFVNYPTPPELYVDSPDNGNWPAVVDNCGVVNYELFLPVSFNEEYVGSYTFYESDASGSPGDVIVQGQQGAFPLLTFGDLINAMKLDFTNLLDPNFQFANHQGLVGFVLIELNIDHAYDCGFASYQRQILIDIHTPPLIVGFTFEYKDPNGSPTPPIAYLSFTPSQNLSSPTLLGGFSGRANIVTNTQHFSSWVMEVERQDVMGWVLVASKSGASSFGVNFLQNVMDASMGYQSGDEPIFNQSYTYRFTVTVSTPNCGSSTDFGYFKIDPDCITCKTNPGFSVNTLPNGTFQVVAHENSVSSFNSQWTAQLTDLTGKVLASKTATDKMILFDRDYSRGIYLISVSDENGQVLWAQKVIK